MAITTTAAMPMSNRTPRTTTTAPTTAPGLDVSSGDDIADRVFLTVRIENIRTS